MWLAPRANEGKQLVPVGQKVEDCFREEKDTQRTMKRLNLWVRFLGFLILVNFSNDWNPKK